MKAIGIFLMILAVSAATRYGYQKFFSTPQCAPPAGMQCASLEHLRHIGKEISATLPKDLSSETRLTRVWARESELVYDVRLINYSSKNLNREKLEQAVFQGLKGEFCGDSKARAFKKYGVVATFQISGNDGFNVGHVSVGLNDCD